MSVDHRLESSTLSWMMSILRCPSPTHPPPFPPSSSPASSHFASSWHSRRASLSTLPAASRSQSTWPVNLGILRNRAPGLLGPVLTSALCRSGRSGLLDISLNASRGRPRHGPEILSRRDRPPRCLPIRCIHQPSMRSIILDEGIELIFSVGLLWRVLLD